MKDLRKWSDIKQALLDYHNSLTMSRYLTEEDCRNARFAVEGALYALEEVPAVDAVEVKHGRWVVIDDDYGWDSEMDDEFYYVLECECSECHGRVKLDRPNYCPNCGARMGGE